MTADTQAQGDLPELPLAFEYIYGFASPFGGEHRKMTDARWNGNKPSAYYTVYSADQMRAYGQACAAAALQGRGTQEGEPSDPWALLHKQLCLKPDPCSECDRIAALAHPSRVSVEIREAM